jgi:hypothetical protein
VARSTAYKFIRIATVFAEKAALTIGSEKLEVALRYIDATPEDETPEQIPSLKVPVVTKGGRTRRKPLAEATIAELKQATRRAHEKGRASSDESADADAQSFLERARGQLDRANLEETRIHLRSGKVSVSGVDFGNAWRTFAILAKVARND